jgi:hypothetical protein
MATWVHRYYTALVVSQRGCTLADREETYKLTFAAATPQSVELGTNNHS